MISCSNLYQDLTTTTVEFTKESIASIKSRASGDDENYVIFATVTCENKTQIKTVDITKVQDANGVTLQFDKLPVGKTGTLYVSVGSKKVESELEAYYSENIAELDGKTQFTVQPNGNTKIKVSLKENEERFFAQFLTFPYNEESPISYIELNFTEYSTITAPLPVGTTRWQINHNDNGNITYLGSFGEKIDVKKELMNYKKYFDYQGEGKPISVNLQGTGESLENIKTPIVYSSFDSTSNPNSPYLYNFANSLNEVGENTESLLNLPSELADYCFDNAGNLYFIMDESAFKLAYDFDTNSYESVIIDEYGPFYYEEYTRSIAYDQAQNALYLLTGEPTAEDTNLVKFSNPAGTIYKESGVSQAGSTNFSLPTEGVETDSQSWTVHNGKIYVASVRQDENSSSYNLVLQEYEYKADSTNNTWGWTSGADKKYPIDVKTTNLNFTTDIMYQDNSLYIIFSCYNTNWNIDNNYSTGGILKYDIGSEHFDNETFGIKGFATENSKKINSPSTPNISFYAPTNETESTSFYGPKQFVAIMPKKLVFLDSGADVSSYDANLYPDNSWKIPSKSRIVEYNLSTKSFSSKEILSSDLGFNFTGFSM